MDNILLTPHRFKRGAIAFVGSVVNALFGVLGSEYAKKMFNTIEMIKGKEQHIMSLLKNQTSIIDASIKIIKQDEAVWTKTPNKTDYSVHSQN